MSSQQQQYSYQSGVSQQQQRHAQQQAEDRLNQSHSSVQQLQNEQASRHSMQIALDLQQQQQQQLYHQQMLQQQQKKPEMWAVKVDYQGQNKPRSSDKYNQNQEDLAYETQMLLLQQKQYYNSQSQQYGEDDQAQYVSSQGGAIGIKQNKTCSQYSLNKDIEQSQQRNSNTIDQSNSSNIDFHNRDNIDQDKDLKGLHGNVKSFLNRTQVVSSSSREQHHNDRYASSQQSSNQRRSSRQKSQQNTNQGGGKRSSGTGPDDKLDYSNNVSKDKFNQTQKLDDSNGQNLFLNLKSVYQSKKEQIQAQASGYGSDSLKHSHNDQNSNTIQMSLQQQFQNDQMSRQQNFRNQDLQNQRNSTGAAKKKAQPNQPRNREESTQRRNGRSGGNSQSDVDSHQQSNQSSSSSTNGATQGTKKQGTYYSNLVQKNQQQVNNSSDKFSQLVCQVPQGQTTSQMPNQAQSPQQQTQIGVQQQQYLLGPQRPSEQGRKTLVLDLDETLVHSSFKPVENADIQLPVEIDGQICTIYVLVRPYVSEFLKRMHKIYELVIFTASLSKYAEPLMGHLDPTKMCSYLLFREHCTFFNNAFVKDLTRLGRPMTDVIIVDNSPVAYLFQPENAIPAVNWYDDPTDTELPRIATICEKLAQEQDVRKIIKTIISNNKIEPRQEQLYLASRSNTHKREKSQRVDRRVRPQDPQMAKAQTQKQQKVDEINSNQDSKQQIAIGNNIRVQNQQPNTKSQDKLMSQGKHSRTQAQQQQQPQKTAVRKSYYDIYVAPEHGSNSRYDSSDNRTKQLAMITAQLDNQKLQNDPNIEIMLQNKQNGYDFNQSSDNDISKKATSQGHQRQQQSSGSGQPNKLNTQEMKQAYQHHQTQIMQLKNEIAALKGHQQVMNTGTYKEQMDTKNYRKQKEEVDMSVMQEQQKQATRQHAEKQATNQRKSVKKETQKQKESSEKAKTASQVNRVNPHAINSSNIQFLNQQKIQGGDKVRASRDAQNNSHLTGNTKQIIKLIRKNENHSNTGISSSHVNFNTNLQSSSHTQQSNARQIQQPGTAKNQTKQHFAFTQDQGESLTIEQHQMLANQSNQPSNGFVNQGSQRQGSTKATSKGTKPQSQPTSSMKTSSMMHGTSHGSSHGQRNSHTKQYSNSNFQGKNIQTSHHSSDVRTSNPVQSTKRSSSVKNSSSTHGYRQSYDNANLNYYQMQRKHGGTSTGYSNIAAYDQQNRGEQETHHRRTRGNSAQPMSGSYNHHSQLASNQLLMSNLNPRSSSTTNKGKKTTSSMSANFQNLVNTGSMSVKNTSQHGQMHMSSSHHGRGGGSERQHSTGKTSTRQTTSKHKSSYSTGGHKSHQVDYSRREDSSSKHYANAQKQSSDVLYSSNMQKMIDFQAQLNATQKLSPSSALNLSSQGMQPSKKTTRHQNHGHGINTSQTPTTASTMVKSNLKDIQVYDMLRLTQQNQTQSPQAGIKIGYPQTTRNSKTAKTQSSLAQNEDFLQKVKLQSQATKPGDRHQNQRANLSDVGINQNMMILLQEGQGMVPQTTKHSTGGSVLTIKSPKYAVGGHDSNAGTTKESNHQKILNDIMNMSQLQREHKSGSAATTYQKHSIVLHQGGGSSSTNDKPTIKKIRGMSSSNQNGRMSGQSNQSAPSNTHKSSTMKRGDSNYSRGSDGHVHNSHQSSHNPRGSSNNNREHSRRAQQFNQTMRFSDNGSRGGGIISLLNDLIPGSTTNMAGSGMPATSTKNQTAADIFLQSHQNDQQFSQTTYFSAGQLAASKQNKHQRQ